ncbi:hypothetical protein M8C21_030296 [Ambrosia artemisiifolia]|uniref:Uncharacterized protein n=1 Tax=Ambrosia artemisiifolia TaxID=4212 RepID=A0AAD5GBV8_AMBAR|nr:hypothetical protein M8C21_030296 [Ambrosia artemisiifolia]
MMSDRSLWSTRMSKFYFGCSNASNKFPSILNATLEVPKLDQKSFWKDSRILECKCVMFMISKVYAAFVNGFWTCVDMASGRYLLRNLAIVMEYVAGEELFDKICNAGRSVRMR